VNLILKKQLAEKKNKSLEIYNETKNDNNLLNEINEKFRLENEEKKYLQENKKVNYRKELLAQLENKNKLKLNDMLDDKIYPQKTRKRLFSYYN